MATGVWVEGQADCGAQEVGRCLRKRIKGRLPSSVKKFPVVRFLWKLEPQYKSQ